MQDFPVLFSDGLGRIFVVDRLAAQRVGVGGGRSGLPWEQDDLDLVASMEGKLREMELAALADRRRCLVGLHTLTIAPPGRTSQARRPSLATIGEPVGGARVRIGDMGDRRSKPKDAIPNSKDVDCNQRREIQSGST